MVKKNNRNDGDVKPFQKIIGIASLLKNEPSTSHRSENWPLLKSIANLGRCAKFGKSEVVTDSPIKQLTNRLTGLGARDACASKIKKRYVGIKAWSMCAGFKSRALAHNLCAPPRAIYVVMHQYRSGAANFAFSLDWTGSWLGIILRFQVASSKQSWWGLIIDTFESKQ